MGKFKIRQHLRLVFFFAVLIPSFLLAFLAVRSIEREKAYIAIKMQDTLSAELANVVAQIRSELEQAQDELFRTSPTPLSPEPATQFSNWKANSNLVDVPFLLSQDYEILWPRMTAAANEAEQSFLNWNRDFFSNLTEIPVYQNIALLYKDQIISNKPAEAKALAGGDSDKVKLAALAEEPPTAPGKEGVKKDPGRELLQDQIAVAEFEKNESVRQEVYKQAKEQGQQTLPRAVRPSTGMATQTAEPRQQESIYISEPRRFAEIISEHSAGVIPRFIEENLTLLFWKKEQNGNIIGCLIKDTEIKNRFFQLLPAIVSRARILTILNENGKPLVTPDEEDPRDWRQPFIAQEISELLPRWEVAAYLPDPSALTSRANYTALILWLSIGALFLLILSSGTYILKALRIETDLAQKKTSFVTNVSHELKTPLTSIRMFAEMLREKRQQDPEKQQKYLNIMVSESERLTRLINNVLDFSRMEKEKKQYDKKMLDIAFLCEDTLESQRDRLENIGYKLDFHNETGAAYIYGDEEALKQTLINLLSNAEKYSDENKHIEIEIKRTEKDVLINVKDRGIGIPSQDEKNIFKEFYRVNESLTTRVRGSGLGLTIALKIIQDHAGNIVYFPRDGGGSIFQITLPARDSHD